MESPETNRDAPLLAYASTPIDPGVRFFIPLLIADLSALCACFFAAAYAGVEEPFYGDHRSWDDMLVIHAIPLVSVSAAMLLNFLLLRKLRRCGRHHTGLVMLIVASLCIGSALLLWLIALDTYEGDRSRAHEMRAEAEYEAELERRGQP